MTDREQEIRRETKFSRSPDWLRHAVDDLLAMLDAERVYDQEKDAA